MACAHFRTGSFAKGVALVDTIGELADAANHHPDVDLRYSTVTVRLSSHDVGGLRQRDVELARQVSAAARELEVPADPSAVGLINLAIDALVAADVQPFWRALLGYQQDGPEDLIDPQGSGPSIWFGTWTSRGQSAIASTSTSPCRTTWPRSALRRRLPPAASW